MAYKKHLYDILSIAYKKNLYDVLSIAYEKKSIWCHINSIQKNIRYSINSIQKKHSYDILSIAYKKIYMMSYQ